MKEAGLGIAYHTEGCGCECCGGDQGVPVGPVYVAPVPEVTPVEPSAKNFEVVEARKGHESILPGVENGVESRCL